MKYCYALAIPTYGNNSLWMTCGETEEDWRRRDGIVIGQSIIDCFAEMQEISLPLSPCHHRQH